MGPRWSSFSPAEQHALITAFRQFTVATRVANFNEYNGERFEISPDLRSTGAGEVVSTRSWVPVRTSPASTTSCGKAAAAAQVVDVLLDGSISRVAVQRSDFRALLGDHEPSALIGSLRQKTAELSRGTLTR